MTKFDDQNFHVSIYIVSTTNYADAIIYVIMHTLGI